MVWPFLMGFSALLCVGSIWAREWRFSALVILIAYSAMQFKKVTYDGDEWAFVVSAAIWICAAAAIQRQIVYASTQMRKCLTCISGFLASAGLCYFWAKLTSAPREFGSLPYLVADLAVIAAMLIIGRSICAGIYTGNWFLGRTGFRGDALHSPMRKNYYARTKK